MSIDLPPPPPPPGLPPPPPFPGSSSEPKARVRWATGDAVWAFVVGIAVSVLAAVFVIHAAKPVQLIVLIAAQDLSIIAYLAVVARRRGVGSLRADFGFTIRPAAEGFLAGLRWLVYGVLLQLAALVPIGILEAVHGGTARQDVVNTADQARGVEVALMVLCVAVLAPVTEELLFRGAFLRSFLRRMTPDRAVFLAAVLFALVHLIGDPSVGSLIALPAIMLLGVISGYQAVRTGNLSRSMMLHMGFNLLSVFVLFT